jgi:hypothetical protein
LASGRTGKDNPGLPGVFHPSRRLPTTTCIGLLAVLSSSRSLQGVVASAVYALPLPSFPGGGTHSLTIGLDGTKLQLLKRIIEGVSPLSRDRVTATAILLAALFLQLGCGGSSPGSGSSGGGAGSVTSVSVSGPANMQSPYCSNFQATVSGTGNYSNAVQWYVNGVAGGNSTDGTIDATGSFCAPSQPPANNPVSIKAVATANSAISGTASVRIILITISPSQTQMYVGATQQFTATVTGGVNNNITWQVNQVVGGNSTIGTISPTGLYTAPSQYTNIGITVVASNTDPTIEVGANINLSALTVISPSNPQITSGNTQQFTATIEGAPQTQVNWLATYGAITSSGLYTATGTQSPDTITAWTATARGTTSVNVLGATPAITGISPQPAGVFDTLTVAGTNLSPVLTAVFSDVMGGPIYVRSTNATGTSATFTVPQGAVSGNFFVTSAQGTLTPMPSNTVQFQRLARLRIHSALSDLAAGQSATIQYALLGDNTPTGVTFSADVGTFSGATYTAPATVNADTFAHITGCITPTQSCSTMILELHPFLISPEVPLVAAGTFLQLSAELGAGTTTATWSLLAGGGSLSSSGLYSAGSALQSGGPAPVSAVANGATEMASVGVTGEFPGLVNRLAEYADQNDPNFEGVYPWGMAIIGNRLYVLDGNHIGGYTDSYYWFDVYDISDPLHPVWLTAAESNCSGPIFASGQYLYSYQGDLEAPPGSFGGVMLYSVQSGVPVLIGHVGYDQMWNISSNHGVVSGVSYNYPQGSADIFKADVTSGAIVSQNIIATLPSEANTFIPDTSIIVGNKLYISVTKNDNSGRYLVTYDLTTSPPTLLGTVDGGSLAFYSSGNLLFTGLSGMEIYDISSGLPQFQSYIDSINAANLNGTQLLAYTEQQGCLLLDVSNPQIPQITATLFDGVISGCNSPQFVGNYVYANEYVGGVAIYDSSHVGGPVFQTNLNGGGGAWSDIYDMLVQSPYVYGAASTDFGEALNIYDTSTSPASRVGEYLDPSQEAFSLQSSGHYLYVGGSSYTTVLDVTQPTSPTLVTNVPVSAISLARSNNTLFAGTNNNQLAVLDLTNPAQPVVVNTLALPDVPLHVRVSGPLLLVADNLAGLMIYDITTPQSPVLRSQVTNIALAADVTVVGQTAFIAADADGLVIFDISNPASPVLLSKTSLSRIDPFSNDNPLNEALTVAANNGLIYVGTINDNGIVFGLDCTHPATPRIVSIYAYGDFILTWIGALAFDGNSIFVGGSLGFTYPFTQAYISQPYDSIEQDFPPLALQSIPPLGQARRPATGVRLGGHPNHARFPKSVPKPAPPGRKTVSRFSSHGEL